MSNNEKSGKNLQALGFRAKDADDEDDVGYNQSVGAYLVAYISP